MFSDTFDTIENGVKEKMVEGIWRTSILTAKFLSM